MKTNIIYNEDCLSGLSKIPNDSIDLIITSPHYNKMGLNGSKHSTWKKETWNKGRNIEYDVYNDLRDEEEYREEQLLILNECFRVLKENGSMFYNHKVRLSKGIGYHPFEIIQKSDFIFRQQLVWDRGSTPALDKRYFYPTTELIFWLTKTTHPLFERSKISSINKEVLRFNADNNTIHPAPFPIYLLSLIIDNMPYDENYIVLDPFMGSGTTAIAAIRAKRKYIGFEISPNYCKIAEERIKNETLQMNLF